MRLYKELAHWWPLFSPPIHYVEEAADLLPTIRQASELPANTMLELGCGGGSLAFHFKPHFQLTLTDLSPQMLAVSRSVNPECEHLLGDMRTIDVGRQFDRVFIHDAVMYLLDPESVREAIANAARHCRPGGAVIVVPDYVSETFEPATENGGEDHPDGRGLRYLEWTYDPDPSDTTSVAAFAFLLRDANGAISLDQDVQQFGLFPRASWLRWFAEAGLTATSRIDPWKRDVFTAVRG